MLRITEPSELEVPHLVEVVRTHDGRPLDVDAVTDIEETVDGSLEHGERGSQPSDGIWADAKRGFDDDEEEDSDVDFDEFDDEDEEFEADDEEAEKDDYEDEDEDDFDDLDEDLDDDE